MRGVVLAKTGAIISFKDQGVGINDSINMRDSAARLRHLNG